MARICLGGAHHVQCNSDKFFGQWLLLNTPFSELDDLWDARAVLVPESFKFLALCMLKHPRHWSDAAKIRAEMKLEAATDTKIANHLHMLFARQELVQAYLNGELTLQVIIWRVVGFTNWFKS